MSEASENLPNLTTEQMDGVRDAIKEMCHSFLRQDAERDLQKDIADAVKDKYGVPKPAFKKLARLQYAANLAQKIAENEEFLIFAQQVLGQDVSHEASRISYSEE